MSDQTPDHTEPAAAAEPLHATEIVAQEKAAEASPEHVEDSVADILEDALAALRESTKIAADRLNTIWNPETKRYEPRAEMVALHNIVNKNLLAALRLKRALRQAQGLPEDD